MVTTLTNWAGNVAFRAREVLTPRTIDELRQVVSTEPRIRVIGSRHSFSDIADTDGALVSISELARRDDVVVAADRATVRVPAGIRYGDLVPTLEREGLALRNLASLPHISVAGAVQTGTHGSGDGVGSLATQVAGLEILTASGAVIEVRRGDEDFAGHVVGLGALGIVTRLHLDVEPAYEVAQTVYEGVTWDAALADVDALTSAGSSVSLFTRWTDPDRIDQVWVKTRVGAPTGDLQRFGGIPADGARHPLPGVDPTPCTPQGGEPGPWYDRLPHFRLAFTPSSGEELQSEYLVPRSDVGAAIAALRSLAAPVAALLLVCEVRTMAADDLWLSPAYGTDAVGLHFTWRPDESAVRAFLPTLEAALPDTARPHWGKVFTMSGTEIARRYPEWDRFIALRHRLDPERRFGNDYLERLGLLSPGPSHETTA